MRDEAHVQVTRSLPGEASDEAEFHTVRLATERFVM